MPDAGMYNSIRKWLNFILTGYSHEHLCLYTAPMQHQVKRDYLVMRCTVFRLQPETLRLNS